MITIKFNGFGGQGAVTAAEAAALAFWLSGFEAQAFPAFGPERTGQPVAAFTRADKQIIRTREPIAQPDWQIFTDEKLLVYTELTNYLSHSEIIISSELNLEQLTAAMPALKRCQAKQLHLINAKAAAGEAGHSLTINSVLLGAFSGLTGLFGPANLDSAIEQKFKDKGEALVTANAQAAKLGYDAVKK